MNQRADADSATDSTHPDSAGTNRVGVQPAPTFEEALHDMIEADGACPHNLGEHPARVRAAHAAEVEEQRQKVWALELNVEESDECAADLFSLVCALLDGKPEAAEARVQLQKHIEHVRACRKGSCNTELHGSKRVQEARAAGVAEGRRQMAREARERFRSYPSSPYGDAEFSVWLESQAREGKA